MFSMFFFYWLLITIGLLRLYNIKNIINSTKILLLDSNIFFIDNIVSKCNKLNENIIFISDKEYPLYSKYNKYNKYNLIEIKQIKNINNIIGYSFNDINKLLYLLNRYLLNPYNFIDINSFINFMIINSEKIYYQELDDDNIYSLKTIDEIKDFETKYKI